MVKDKGLEPEMEKEAEERAQEKEELDK